jgi:hypothetical protein
MIHRLIDLPPNVIGFKAEWAVTERDCEEVIIPSVEGHIEKANQFNCLVILNDLNNSFKLSALQSLRKIKKLNYDIKRIAIVAESRTTRRLLKIINMLLPCEFKGFSQTEVGEAIHWVSGK